MGKSDGFGFLSKIFIMPQVSLNGSFFLSEINTSKVFCKFFPWEFEGMGHFGLKKCPKMQKREKFFKVLCDGKYSDGSRKDFLFFKTILIMPKEPLFGYGVKLMFSCFIALFFLCFFFLFHFNALRMWICCKIGVFLVSLLCFSR